MQSPLQKNDRRKEGERLKAEALDMLAAHRESPVISARRALLTCALATGKATADDVRDNTDSLPGLDPRYFGSVPGPLAKAKIIYADGYEKTCRPVAHARPLTIWKIRNREKALQWLAAHPEPAQPISIASQSQSLLPFLSPSNETGETALTVTPAME